MSYYKAKRAAQKEIVHWLHNQEDEPWQDCKRRIQHMHVEIGDLTIKRILKIYNVRENAKGELEHATPLHNDAGNPDAGREEPSNNTTDV